ncbi:MAG: signal peptide peptidase SppA [Magnetospirillum sp.]|nr:signal peptide peptidase SppA [Magnetospirillum sp.]
MRRLGRVVVVILAVVGLFTVASVSLALWAASRLPWTAEKALPQRMMLTVDLDGDFREAPDGSPFAHLTGEKAYVLRDVVQGIDRAAKDDRVAGLFATIGTAKFGLAGAQEIRDAVTRFRASGKPAVLFAESLGDFGNGTLEYYAASAFGQVWLQPSGDVGITGFLAQSPFLKGTLDMLGIEPQFAARYQYKSAIDVFTEKGFTDAHRQNLGALLDSWWGQTVTGIAAGRKLSPDTVQALINKGPLLASEALSAGLVDKLGYRDEAKAAAWGGKPAGKDVDIGDYARRTTEHRGTTIAVVTGTGAIHSGASDNPFDGEQGFGAKTIAKAIRDAVADPQVKAILFRVDSPGGSYVASDTVWHEVVKARAAGKPVVVSMGDVAASGGYFVGMAADRVVAEPGTITGSIGVFAGKIVLADLWGKLGVNWGEMNRGDDAGMWSMNQPFTPQAWERVNAMLDHIYADFTTKAEQGRHIPADRMDALARGRVWSGADAKAVGLVDELGGFDVALGEVRKLVKLAPDAPLRLKTFPRPKGPLEMLAALFDGAGHDMAGMRSLTRAAQALGPLAVRLQDVDPRVAAELRLPAGMVPALHQGGTP